MSLKDNFSRSGFPHLRLQNIPRISRLFLGKLSTVGRKWPLQLSVSTNHECSREKIIVTYSFQSILLLYIKCKALYLARFWTTFKGYLDYRRLRSLQSKMSMVFKTGTLPNIWWNQWISIVWQETNGHANLLQNQNR